ncbi:MAG: hypothetical protein LBS52_01720 [Dysgonamonadaceae bacterium]|jgi:hypothetical protein|nr:hypothetical protein [Dysgonamonadaceae bacterium]
MKKSSLYLFLFFAGFTVSAQNTVPMSHADSLYSMIEQVGILHNEGLDTVIPRTEVEKIKLCEEYGVTSIKNLPDSVKSSLEMQTPIYTFPRRGYTDSMTKQRSALANCESVNVLTDNLKGYGWFFY